MTFVKDEGSNSSVNIKVIGVGGGGGNAINNMINKGIAGVEYVAINTDVQALKKSAAVTQVAIGANITRGFGAGANPEVGSRAAEESLEQIKDTLQGTDMVFITCGMGGGTGTGAAPVVARKARDMNILTVGVVTKPFKFEGNRRMKNAEAGIEELRQYVDALLVIPNDRLSEVSESRITLANAFAASDDILLKGVKSISDIIQLEGYINVDFADLTAVMKDSGYAHMGVGYGKGPNKAEEAARMAISSPLLETEMIGANGVLINIYAPSNLGLEDATTASLIIQDQCKPDANIIWGVRYDDDLQDEMRITVVATNFDTEATAKSEVPVAPANKGTEPKVVEPAKPEPEPEEIKETPAEKKEEPKKSDLDSLLDGLL